MRILFIHNRYKQAGGEDVALEGEVTVLKQSGHQVEVLIFDNSQISHHPFPLGEALKAIYNRSSKRRVTAVIDSFKPEVIHIHNLFFLASPSVLYAARNRKVPVIFTLHNYRLICCNALLLRNNTVCELCVHKTLPPEGVKYKCYRSSYTQSALVTAITGLHKKAGTWTGKVHTFITLTSFARSKFMHSSLGVSGNQLITKPNFVEDNGVGAFPRNHFFLFVGRIAPEKGVSLLLQSFTEMHDQTLFIVGDGPDKAELEKQYAGYKNISFLGQLPKNEVLDLLKKTRALVFPSIWYEGLPFTILEAFSTATPVIASKLGAMAETIQDGYNGFHFEAGSVQGLINCIRKFNLLEAQHPQLNRQARMTYEEKYHPGVHYKSILSIYTKAIEDKTHE